jgi:hypothetical protein
MKKNYTKYQRSIDIMAEKTKGLSDKYKKSLGSYPAITTTVNKNSPLSKLGPQGKFSSVLRDMPKDKPSRLSNAIKNLGKRSIVGRVINAATTAGLGAAAGYEYAKSKFKKDDKSKDVKVDKKATGGMADYIKDLL